MRNIINIILLFITLLFQGCIVAKPKVENAAYMLAGFDHTNFLSSCVACHETKRPAPVAAVAHGGGADCAGCHRPPSWLYSHNPTPTSCNQCHDQSPTKRPTTSTQLNAAGVAVVTNSHFGATDCVQCHTPATGTYPAAWAFNHLPKQTTCSSCHEIKRPVTVNGASHVATGDCVNCHTVYTWQAFSHSPKPASCNGCHASIRPASNRSHNSDYRRHYTSLDCVSCHATPTAPYGNNWNTGATMNCRLCHR